MYVTRPRPRDGVCAYVGGCGVLYPRERPYKRDGARGVDNPAREGDCGPHFQAVTGDNKPPKEAENREAVGGGEEDRLHGVKSILRGREGPP